MAPLLSPPSCSAVPAALWGARAAGPGAHSAGSAHALFTFDLLVAQRTRIPRPLARIWAQASLASRNMLPSEVHASTFELLVALMQLYTYAPVRCVDREWRRRLHEVHLHFRDVVLYEVRGLASDRCGVCLASLNGYEDGRCVMCTNIRICADCVQVADQDIADSGRSCRYLWDAPGQRRDESSIQTGDFVCLQCAEVGRVSAQQARWLAGFDIACNGWDCMMRTGDYHPRKTLVKACLHGWKTLLRATGTSSAT